MLSIKDAVKICNISFCVCLSVLICSSWSFAGELWTITLDCKPSQDLFPEYDICANNRDDAIAMAKERVIRKVGTNRCKELAVHKTSKSGACNAANQSDRVKLPMGTNINKVDKYMEDQMNSAIGR